MKSPAVSPKDASHSKQKPEKVVDVATLTESNATSGTQNKKHGKKDEPIAVGEASG